MLIISHRGNIIGPDSSVENTCNQVDKCIALGYSVEVDVWSIEGELLLGHDSPDYPVNLPWLIDRKSYLFVHCKNIHAMHYLIPTGINVFSHDTDDFVLTSRRDIWVYPGKPLVSGSIAVLPEKADYGVSSLLNCYGVCTDYPVRYSELLR